MLVKFDSKSLQKAILSEASNGITKGEYVLTQELKRLTPEDTREMLNSYKVNDKKQTINSVEGSVTNTSDHALIVEYGVEGRKYNYHKPKGSVFYKGTGNRTFARATDNKRNEVISLIHKAIGG